MPVRDSASGSGPSESYSSRSTRAAALSGFTSWIWACWPCASESPTNRYSGWVGWHRAVASPGRHARVGDRGDRPPQSLRQLAAAVDQDAHVVLRVQRMTCPACPRLSSCTPTSSRTLPSPPAG